MNNLEAVKCKNMSCWCRKTCRLVEDNEEECVHYIAPTEKDDKDIAQDILDAIHLLEENGYTVSKKKG